MRPLYRLQSRLGLTSSEGGAALVLALAGALSVGALEVQEHTGPPAAALYAESDAAFAAAVRGAAPAAAPLLADSSARPALALAPLAPDSTADGILPVAAVAPDAPPAPEAATEAPSAPVTAGRLSGRKVPARANLNTGTAAELQRLPGVGPAIAQRIIDYRAQHGPFRSVGDVVGVKGIGPKTLEKMRPYAHL